MESSIRFWWSLFIARQQIFRTFPRRKIVERAKFLDELHGFIDHALQLVVIANFHMPREWKVFAQRMTRESIVSEYPPQIRMTVKQHAVKIKYFPFIPVSGGKYFDNTWNGGCLVGSDFYTNSLIPVWAEEMIDEFKAVRPFRVVGTGKVDKAYETAIAVVTEVSNDFRNGVRFCLDGEFPESDLDASDSLAQISGDPVSKALERLLHLAGLSISQSFRYDEFSFAAA